MPINFSRSRSTRAVLILSIVAAAVLVVGLVSRHTLAEKLEQGAAGNAMPTVSVFTPSLAATGSIELPARIEPWARAPIYARVSGYLESWNVDIGTPVKAGQLLARIETPDLDQQLLQARAEVASARSNVVLAESTAKRWSALLEDDAVSRQEADERSGDLAARRAALQALQANVQRIEALQGYTRLSAPFDGIITARNTDVGALINVGSVAGSELFVVSDIRKLRVYVQVPQRQIAMIVAGARAQLSVPERAGKSWTATVQSQARSINAASGAMLVQLSVDNEAGDLLPGAFATIRFDMPGGAGTVSIPPGALILGQDGARVATVDSANRVRIRPVSIARDLGNMVQLSGGVSSTDRVIDSPPDGIVNGELVRIAVADRKAAP